MLFVKRPRLFQMLLLKKSGILPGKDFWSGNPADLKSHRVSDDCTRGDQDKHKDDVQIALGGEQTGRNEQRITRQKETEK